VNRDPLAIQNPHVSRVWGGKLLIEIENGPNLYWPLGNNPITRHDPDGRIVGVPFLLCVIFASLTLCSGCSKVIPDPYGCWAEGNKYGVGFPGPTKPGKPAGLQFQYMGCVLCCEDKFPIKGGDPEKFEDCVKYCELHRAAGR
jgi:hypothetical protein